MINLKVRISEDGITATATWRDGPPAYVTDMDEMDWWDVRLRMGRRQMTVPFGMGYGHDGREPDAYDVLSCLLSDASGADESFEDWCAGFGYDTDSRKAESTYRAIVRQTARLRKFLGDKFSEYLYETEE